MVSIRGRRVLGLLVLLGTGRVQALMLPEARDLAINPAIYPGSQPRTFADIPVGDRPLFDFEPHDLDVKNQPPETAELLAKIFRSPEVTAIKGPNGLTQYCRIPAPLTRNSVTAEQLDQAPRVAGEMALNGGRDAHERLQRQLLLARKLQPSCVSMTAQYWTYEVCPFKYVRQFRRKDQATATEGRHAIESSRQGEEGAAGTVPAALRRPGESAVEQPSLSYVIPTDHQEVITEEYLLGRYLPPSSPAPEESSPSSSSSLSSPPAEPNDRLLGSILVQTYQDGDRCESLRDAPPRQVQIHYECDGPSESLYRIISVAEITSCVYRVRLGSPIFCLTQDPLRSTVRSVVCHPDRPPNSATASNLKRAEARGAAGRKETSTPSRAKGSTPKRERLRAHLYKFLTDGAVNFPLIHKVLSEFMANEAIEMPEDAQQIPESLLRKWLAILGVDVASLQALSREQDRGTRGGEEGAEDNDDADEDESDKGRRRGQRSQVERVIFRIPL